MEEGSSISVLEFISEEVGRTVTAETRIEDLGIDSLDFISLIQSIGEKFKEIPDSEFVKLNTVGDIVKAVA